MAPTPDITESLPSLLSARQVSSDGQARGVLYDVVISGMGFVFDISSQNPYQRETVPVQKQQIDTSTEAGEQTLDGNWVRSQTSWHLGAGAAYYEPGNRDETTPSKFRFKDSRGVNPWNPGELTLHAKMDAVDVTAVTAAVCGARLSTGEDVWYSRVGNTINRHHSGGITAHGTEAVFSFADARLCATGSYILCGSNVGVYRTALTGATIDLIATQGATGPLCQPYWAKSRVIMSRNNELHQLTTATGQTIDNTPGTGTILWAHPDTGWRWTGVTESPDAILAAGAVGGVSSIYAFTLTENTAGTAPKLGQPFQVAELPPGEEIRSIQSYLGLYLGIGTTAGIRVGVLGQGGQVQYGPLLVETDDPVTALGARDSFLYAAAGSSVIRVNLGDPVDGDRLIFPYAYDVEVPSGTIGHLAFDGVSDRVVVSVDGVGTFAASETECVTSGWLESGDIRYGTTAPKAFRLMDVNARTNATTAVAISAVLSGTQSTIVTLRDGKSGTGVSLGSLPSPLSQLSYRLDLTGGATTPTVEAVAVKAIPVPHRQRMVKYPVIIADHTRDSKGRPFGKDGFAHKVLQALEALEETRTVVTVSDLTRGEQFDASIERIEFTRVEPRARNGAKNFGGVANIVVKTL